MNDEAPSTVDTVTPADEPWRDARQPAGERVRALLAGMTLPEKIALALSDFAAVAHLGVPPLVYTDSGNGVRQATGVTAFPVALALAATFDVDLSGSEVVQVYVAPPADAGPAMPALKVFRKVRLSPGETVPVRLELRTDDLRGYDRAGGWTLANGRHDILVGASSRDVRLRGSVEL